MTHGRGTQSQKHVSASGASVISVVALRPNNAFQPKASPCGLGFPRFARLG